MSREAKTTTKQYEILVDFMEKHPGLFHSKPSPYFTAKRKQELWLEVTSLLNSPTLGPQKKPNKWQKSWSDFKYTVQVKAGRQLTSMRKSGGSENTYENLTALERRVMKLIERDATYNEEVLGNIRTEQVEEMDAFIDEPNVRFIIPSASAASETESEQEESNIVPESAEESNIVPELIEESNEVPESVEEIGKGKARKRKRSDSSLDDMKFIIKSQNVILNESLIFIKEIAESQAMIADSQKMVAEAEYIKAQALSDIACTFKDFVQKFKK